MWRTLIFLLFFVLLDSEAARKTLVSPDQLLLRAPEREGVYLVGVMYGPDGNLYFTTVQLPVGVIADTPVIDPPYRTILRPVGQGTVISQLAHMRKGETK
ncbi:MAG TPA: hypothetical protein PKJ41_03770 [Bryobacteraceae bacterium]|nr:hypothetical protein [Bryobacteraceae bacterium]